MPLIDKGEHGMKQYVAYAGAEFTIEWYYDIKGQSQALEYFSKQPKDKQRKILKSVSAISVTLLFAPFPLGFNSAPCSS